MPRPERPPRRPHRLPAAARAHRRAASPRPSSRSSNRLHPSRRGLDRGWTRCAVQSSAAAVGTRPRARASSPAAAASVAECGRHQRPRSTASVALSSRSRSRHGEGGLRREQRRRLPPRGQPLRRQRSVQPLSVAGGRRPRGVLHRHAGGVQQRQCHRHRSGGHQQRPVSRRRLVGAVRPRRGDSPTEQAPPTERRPRWCTARSRPGCGAGTTATLDRELRPPRPQPSQQAAEPARRQRAGQHSRRSPARRAHSSGSEWAWAGRLPTSKGTACVAWPIAADPDPCHRRRPTTPTPRSASCRAAAAPDRARPRRVATSPPARARPPARQGRRSAGRRRGASASSTASARTASPIPIGERVSSSPAPQTEPSAARQPTVRHDRRMPATRIGRAVASRTARWPGSSSEAKARPLFEPLGGVGLQGLGGQEVDDLAGRRSKPTVTCHSAQHGQSGHAECEQPRTSGSGTPPARRSTPRPPPPQPAPARSTAVRPVPARRRRSAQAATTQQDRRHDPARWSPARRSAGGPTAPAAAPPSATTTGVAAVVSTGRQATSSATTSSAIWAHAGRVAKKRGRRSVPWLSRISRRLFSLDAFRPLNEHAVLVADVAVEVARSQSRSTHAWRTLSLA